MSTWTAPEDARLTMMLSQVVALLEHQHAKGAAEAAREMCSVVTPGNGFRTAHVPFAVRGTVAAALRSVAATLRDCAAGYPPADRLDAIAAGWEQDAAIRAANGQR